MEQQQQQSTERIAAPLVPLRRLPSLCLAALAVVAFHVAFLVPSLSPLVLVYLCGLFSLRRVASARWAFYLGLLAGLGVCAPQMSWLWTIFGVGAIPLWLVLAFWIALFLYVLNRVDVRWGADRAALLAPVLWLGLEYFRSELYWLRFAWFTPGSVFVEGAGAWWVRSFGVYGAGFVAMAVAAWSVRMIEWRRRAGNEAGTSSESVERRVRDGFAVRRPWLVAGGLVVVVLVAVLLRSQSRRLAGATQTLSVAGIQLELPGPPEILAALDRCVAAHPAAELIVLSEYSFDGPVPERVKRWCRERGKWLIAGGKETLGETNYYNTAFVVSTNGEVVFQQAKVVPLQFFRDGRPATGQRVWDSPWGRIGIAICYDLSYTRVVDELIRQGARLIIAPALDATEWGAVQHRQNARMTVVRALEYGVPIFRVAGSGISQLIASEGRIVSHAPFPGQGEMLAGELRWVDTPVALPLDRWIAVPSVVGSAALMLSLLVRPGGSRRRALAAPTPLLSPS